MHRVFLGLGSNLEDCETYIMSALQELSKIIHIEAISSLFKTEPVGYRSQPEFLNLVAEIKTSLDPPELFKSLKSVEETVGRKHKEHLKQREIDIDILLYEGLTFKDEGITVPHEQMHRRRFVLVPLDQIAPGVIHPVFNKTIASLLHACPDSSHVVLYKNIVLHGFQELP